MRQLSVENTYRTRPLIYSLHMSHQILTVPYIGPDRRVLAPTLNMPMETTNSLKSSCLSIGIAQSQHALQLRKVSNLWYCISLSQPVRKPTPIFILTPPLILLNLLCLCPPPRVYVEMGHRLQLPLLVESSRSNQRSPIEQTEQWFTQLLARTYLIQSLKGLVKKRICSVLPYLR